MRGVKEHPVQAHLAEALVHLAIAVFRVAGQRMADMRGMHADLVGAAGAQRGLHQAGAGVLFHLTEKRQ